MLDHHYTRLATEVNIYIRHHGSIILIVAIYVDDIVMLSNNLVVLNLAKSELSTAFDMTDGGPLHYCLGIHVSKDPVSLAPFLFISTSSLWRFSNDTT